MFLRCYGANYPMLAAAAAMGRQTAWKRYRPGRSPDQHSTGKGAAPGAAVIARARNSEASRARNGVWQQNGQWR